MQWHEDFQEFSVPLKIDFEQIWHELLTLFLTIMGSKEISDTAILKSPTINFGYAGELEQSIILGSSLGSLMRINQG